MSAWTGAQVKTIGAAWREFRAKRAPWLIAAAIVAALAARLAIGGVSWRDGVAVAFMAVVYPFGEWAIHVHLLHLRPFRWRGRTTDLPTAASITSTPSASTSSTSRRARRWPSCCSPCPSPSPRSPSSCRSARSSPRC